MPDDLKTLLARLAFAEATKNSPDEFIDDATGIMHVARNRVGAKGFPKDLPGVVSETRDGVKQFTGYEGPEWQKTRGNMTVEEKLYWNLANQMADAVMRGAYVDPTGGATHYYNPEIANPTWGNMRTPDTVNQWEYYYPEAYKTTGHEFLKRELRRK